MKTRLKFEVYGDPDSTKAGLSELYTRIPEILQSRSGTKRSFSFIRRPELGIGMDGCLYRAYKFASLALVKKLISDPKVSEMMFHFKFCEQGRKTKSTRMLFLHWQRDASTYPRTSGVSEIEMTLSSERGMSRMQITKGQFSTLINVWERIILESNPHYGILWKDGDMFVGTHIFLTHRPEAIYQVNYFGPEMVERVGKERILSVPDLVREYGKKVFPCKWNVKELSTGGIMLYEDSEPSKSGITGNQDILKKHLGIKDINLITL